MTDLKWVLVYMYIASRHSVSGYGCRLSSGGAQAR